MTIYRRFINIQAVLIGLILSGTLPAFGGSNSQPGFLALEMSRHLSLAGEAKKDAMQGEISMAVKQLLREDDEAKKNDYLKRLKSYRQRDIVDIMLDLLNRKRSMSSRVRVIDNLSYFDDRRMVMPLAKLLIHPRRPIRVSAARTLKKVGDDRLYPIVLKMAGSSNPVHRIYFIEAMNYLYDKRFYYYLMGMLRDKSKSVRIYTINCLKKNGITESLGSIRNVALTDRNGEVIIAAIEALGAFRDRNALTVLHRTIKNYNRDVRMESAKSLYLIASPLSVQALSEQLRNERDDKIKDRIMDTLVRIRRVGNVKGLERVLLNDRNVKLRIKSAYTLGLAGNMNAARILMQGLKDSNYRVRAEICNSLGNYRDRKVLEALLNVIKKERSRYVKTAALYSIQKINDKYAALGLFDIYSREKDPIFKEMLRVMVRGYIRKYL
jgi:HEAT repeat protein